MCSSGISTIDTMTFQLAITSRPLTFTLLLAKASFLLDSAIACVAKAHGYHRRPAGRATTPNHAKVARRCSSVQNAMEFKPSVMSFATM